MSTFFGLPALLLVIGLVTTDTQVAILAQPLPVEDLQCSQQVGGYPDIQLKQFMFTPWNDSLPIDQQTTLPTIQSLSSTELHLTAAWSATVSMHNRNCGKTNVQSIQGQGFLGDPRNQQPLTAVSTKFTQSDYQITPEPLILLRLPIQLDFIVPLRHSDCRALGKSANVQQVSELIDCEYQQAKAQSNQTLPVDLLKLQFARNLLRPSCFFSAFTVGQSTLPDDTNLLIYTVSIQISRIMNMLSIQPNFTQRMLMICP